MQLLVSIIVPVYNVEKYLSQCLESIISQTYENLEIICVNDGSTDGSGLILNEYKQQDSRIKVITQENQGLAAARNTGLKHVTGDLVVFVDSDDWLDNSTIESTNKYFLNKEIDFVCFGTMCRYEGHSQKDRNGHVYSQDEIKDACGFWVIGVSPAAWAKVYRTEFLKKNQLLFPVGLFYEDFPFYWSCISYARRIALSSKVLYNYRIRDDSIMGITKTKKPGMAIHHLYGLQKIYIEWERNGFLKTNKSLFRYLFEFYVEAGWKYLHSDDQEEFVAKVLKCSKEWMVHPRRFTLAYDLEAGNSISHHKYRWARSLRKRFQKI